MPDDIITEALKYAKDSSGDITKSSIVISAHRMNVMAKALIELDARHKEAILLLKGAATELKLALEVGRNAMTLGITAKMCEDFLDKK